MNRQAKYMPQHWQDWITENKKGQLSASDFDGSIVLLDFEDGSNARFNYAFFVVDEGRSEIAVFTEHCGYYVFSTRGLSYRRVK